MRTSRFWNVELAIAALGIVGTILGGYLGSRWASKQAAAQWERQYGLQREQWEREDRRRWDHLRATTYAEFVHAVSQMRTTAVKYQVLKNPEVSALLIEKMELVQAQSE